ncbi:MAG: hypothetical protein KAX80_10035, partial [Planctomycetes bacterium]|nr:hypothetical protein [Planctomycetota bacterium]
AAARAAQAGGAVAHAAADALTLQLAAKARRKVLVMTKNLRHDDTSYDRQPLGGALPAFSLLSPRKRRLLTDPISRESKGAAGKPRDGCEHRRHGGFCPY